MKMIQVEEDCHVTLSKNQLPLEPVMQEWVIIGRLRT